MGGGIIRWAVSRPVSVMVGVILLVMFGALSIRGIPIQLTPDITEPSISVNTVWPGATPSEVESEILDKQEEALKSLPGLVKMTSSASRNAGTVTLELEVGASLDEALVRVSNLLSQVSDYPQNAKQPAVSTANSAGPPLAVIIIQSDPPGRDVAEYRTWIDEFIAPRLERIRGVASIRVIGGREQEIQIDFDPKALASRGLTVSAISQSIRAELVDVSAGDIPSGKRRYVVRTEVAPPDPVELERTVLKVRADGTPVLLGQVATVRTGLRKAEAAGMVDGSPSMALLFFREAGSNVLEVTREIHRVVGQLQNDYLAPEGLEMRIVSDQTEYIEGALELVRNNLLLGAGFAVLVLLLFLRSIGASAIVAISIPICIVGTALFMSLMGRTINIVSLAGMAFAVGMVVDNSIVVLENIDTWRKKEHDIARASLMGAREVWGAILASTLTTAAVFIPIITWQDEVGELLRDIAVAVSTAVFVSLVVSVIVIPSFSAVLLRARAKPDDDDGPADSADDEGEVGDEDEELDLDHGRVGGIVHWIARSPIRSVAISGAGIAAAVAVGLTLLPSLEYLPTGNRNIVFGVVVPPPGYSVEEMDRIGQKIQSQIVPHLGVDKDGVPAIQRTFYVGGPDQAFMGASAEDPERVAAVTAFIRRVLGSIPGVFGFASQASLFGRRLGGGRSIEVDITGSDLTQMTAYGGQLLGALNQAMPGSQIRPIPGLDPGAPELRVHPRRAEAAAVGMTSADIGLLVDVYVDGAIIGELGRDGEAKRDVVLRAKGVSIDSAAALEAAPAATPTGQVVPVGRFASVDETLGPTVIQRIERSRAITLQVSPPDDIALEDAIAIVKQTVATTAPPPRGIRLAYAGSAGRLEQTKSRLTSVLLLAVIISFLLLSALFEDFVAPIAILVTVPLAGAGGLLGLTIVDKWLGKQPLDMLTAMGFVILIGVVVNNAILIVDGALSRMRAHEQPMADAVAGAVKWRVRPIMMSALTSLAGLLPLVLFPGAGSELYRGVGGVVLGGLALSTVLSLFLVPAVFVTLWRLRGLTKRTA